MFNPDFTKAESNFFRLLDCLQEYSDSIVVVGGWLPFLYVKYLWKQTLIDPVFTQDIDIGLRHFSQKRDISIHAKLQEAGFESVPSFPDESFPVQFFIKDGETKIPIDFISADPDPGQFMRITGKELEVVNSLNKFDILVSNTNTIKLECEYNGKKFYINTPTPGAYLYHKGITFEERGLKKGYKFKKDIWSIFFILANTPSFYEEELYKQINAFKNDDEFELFASMLKRFFKNASSKGPEYIYEFYQDKGESYKNYIFETVNKLKQNLLKNQT